VFKSRTSAPLCKLKHSPPIAETTAKLLPYNHENPSIYIPLFLLRPRGIIYIDKDISKIAEELIVKYSKSHNLQINDALIAATSIKMNAELITYNVSDFNFIPEIHLFSNDK